MRYFIGIDPGIHTGAVAVVSEHFRLCHVEELPSTDGGQFSYSGTVNLVESLRKWHAAAIYVEHTFSAKGPRLKGHEFAMASGAILQAMHFLANGHDIVRLVASHRWRRTVGLTKDTLASEEIGWKVAANAKCKELWPEYQWLNKIGRRNRNKQGKADAALIALAAAIDYRRENP